MIRQLILVSLTFLTLTSTIAQQKITIEDIYGNGTFSQKTVRNVNWMNQGQFYTARVGNDIIKYDIAKGEQVETLVKGSELNPAIRFISYSFSPDEQKLLLMTNRESIYRRSFTAEYYVYDLASKLLKALSSNGKQSYATFSPDASKVAFTRDNNLYYVNLNDMSEVQVTNDGKFNHVINGSADWVYEEELYLTKAFEWSPDGNKLAYLTFNESEVREYNLQKWNRGEHYPEDYRFKYPKAGEVNSKVGLTIYDLSSKAKKPIDLGDMDDHYIPRINWTNDANLLSVRKLNRFQNQLDLYHVNASTGKAQLILTENSSEYVHITFTDDLTYLKDGKHFIHSSDRSGFKHLYLYTMEGQLVRQITQGDWEVWSFLGINEGKRKSTLYFISTEDSPLERHFYSIGLDGKSKTKLSKVAGNHNVNLSKDFKYYIDYHSNASQPLQVTLYKTKGNQAVKVLEDNQALQAASKSYNLSPKEFFSFKTVDGTDLNGYMLKPAGFDASQKHPVLIFQYSGPGSQMVMNQWAGSNFYWHQMLAQKGYVIAVIDTRGTGARGVAFKKATYKQLGKLETEDHIAGAKYLAGLNYIDASRIGIWGWSYGGFISSSAMFKGGDLFKAGIAVAPVTNWRFYDTIYTERYMQTPQVNASGYDDNSPMNFAEGLTGKFLLVHGTGDDNVHFQNSVALQEALIDAGKQFESFYYPDRAHGIRSNKARPHLFKMMTDFILENL
ncbi:MAG: S9 family peptidase [Bacteroidota bacterium]